ncbi:MAG: hypothetical protein NXI09_07925 [Bacteroidetes bacterium]|nr:hypothetical protein [Bacteroidota bacterium]
MRNCLACDTKLVGRVDKKFCDYNCRNAYHNHHNQPTHNHLSKINRQLLKNHRILSELSEAEVLTAPLAVLETMGFNALYRTMVIDDPKEGQISFIYDIAFQQNAFEIVILDKELETFKQTG